MTSAAKLLERRRAAVAARGPIDLTHLIASDVMNQGPRPTCVACALAAVHEAERPGFEAAVEPIWWRLREWGLAGERGTTMSAAAQALPHTGHCEARLWPYDDSLGFDTEDPPATAGQPPWQVADLTPIRLAHDGVEEDIEDALTAAHPVLVVLEATPEFMTPEPDGFIPVPVVTVPAAGYHAVVVAGAWTDPVRGRVLLIRNSWGDYWGAGGYGLLPPDYLIDFGAEAARVSV